MTTMNRRSFLKVSAALGGGVMVGFSLGGCSSSGASFPNARAGSVTPNAFLQLSREGQIILQLHKAEMGQGVYTGMATLAAEELEIDPALLVVEHGQYHPAFNDPEMKIMLTGGSSSIRNSYLPVREAAATLREILRTAAKVMNFEGAEHAPLAELLDNARAGAQWDDFLQQASSLSIADSPALKNPADFRYIGRYSSRLDAKNKVTGRARFSMDVHVEDACVAVLVRCPHIGGLLLEYDDTAARQQAGVVDIVTVDNAIAVIANGYWSARQGASKLQVKWDKGPLVGVASSDLLSERKNLLNVEDGHKAEEEGEVAAAVGDHFEAEYDVPYLAHAAMEPPSATATVTATTAEIWTGTQGPDLAIAAVARATGIDPENIQIHNHMLGGGFGRRTCPDYIVEAARIAQISGRTIQLVWSREDDIRHDTYRPNASALMRATVDGNRLTSLQSKVCSPSIFASFLPVVTQRLMPGWVPDSLHKGLASLAVSKDNSAYEGLVESPYDVPYKLCRYVPQPRSVPVGYWRSVGHSQNAFFMESFMDELALRCNSDPLTFRLGLLATTSRHHAVLSRAAALAGWGNTPENTYQGLALHESFGTVVAEVVTLSKIGNAIRLTDISCVVDCGTVINPDIVKTQMQSGIVFGLTAALHGNIQLQDGAVLQSNFHDYPALRLAETPDIRVEIISSTAAPAGVGEPSTPPIAPALANALFAATGRRQRSLPLSLS